MATVVLIVVSIAVACIMVLLFPVAARELYEMITPSAVPVGALVATSTISFFTALFVAAETGWLTFLALTYGSLLFLIVSVLFVGMLVCERM